MLRHMKFRGEALAALITLAAVVAILIHILGSADRPAAASAAASGAAPSATGHPGVQPATSQTVGTGGNGVAPRRLNTATPPPPTPTAAPCGWANFEFTITSDKPTYRAGETVWVTLTATYKGSGCQFGGDCIPFVIVRDSGEHAIATTMTPPDCGRFPPQRLSNPTVLQERYPWDQQPLNASGTATTGQEVPRGAYSLTADWHSIGQSRPITIQLLP